MLTLFLAVTLAISALVFRKSKIITVALFGFMWILFGWNYWNGDYDLYEAMYNNPLENIDIFKYEGGYNALMLMSNVVGFTFQQFFIIVSGISLLLLMRFVLIFSELPAFVAFGFFVSFFPIDYVLLRNFIAFTLMLQGLIPVLRNSKWKYQKFVFFVLLASTIHISSLFYLIFLFAFGKKEIRWPVILVYVFVALLFIISFQNFLGGFFSNTNGRDEFYFTKWPQFVIYAFYQILNLCVVIYFFKINKEAINEKFEMNRIIFNINVLLLFLIVIYYDYAIFIRILLNVAIINVILISNQTWFSKNNKAFNNLLLFIYLLFFFGIFVLTVKDDSLLPLYNKNLLLK